MLRQDRLHQFASRLSEAIIRVQQVAVLDLLKFQSVHERFESITQAQEQTFRWLLDSKDSNQSNGTAEATPPDQQEILTQARDRLVEWLRHSDEFFYISGKPGAGKSTLVKFICLHDNFYRHATAWSGSATLLVGRFFFWKPGKPEQKSISGLLRGLLYSILEKTPSIAPIAFPQLSDDLLHQRVKSAVIEHKDVQQAFDNILQSTDSGNAYKIVLTIDGLDEFEGDHAELLQLMKSWVAQYPSSIKICVSSREYGIFEDFFATSPKFRLHELTRGDMSRLVTSRLKPNKFFASLPEDDAEDIKGVLCERAEGVFLWVVMAVAAIDDGLVSRSITNASELKRCVEDFPVEMDEMLPHLLRTIRISSRVWASKAISLVKYAQFKVPEMLMSGDTPPGVGLLDLMLLDESSPNWNMAAFQPRSEPRAADLSVRLEEARKKILGRCKGFLNVITISEARSWPANGDERMYAAVTHRSVVEFLDSEMAQGFMSGYLINFHPFYASFSTMLACLRFLDPSNYPLLKPVASLQSRENLALGDVLADSLQCRWKEMIRCAYLTEQSGSQRFMSLLDSVGDAIKRHLTIQLTVNRIRLMPDAASPYQLLSIMALGCRVYEYSEWRRSPAVTDTAKYPMSMGMLQAFYDVLQPFRLDDYEFPAPDEQSRDGTTLVNKPVDWIKWNLPRPNAKTTCPRLSNLLTEFFARGIDVNWSPEACPGWKGTQTIGRTPWTCWQMFLWAMLVGEVPFADKHAEFTDRFLRHGADPEMTILSAAPLRDVQMERLTPPGGWVLLVPFTKDQALLDEFMDRALTYDHEDRRRFDNVPAVLIRESAPLYKAAKEKGWRFTAQDLLTLWFPTDGGHFDKLCNAAGQSSKTDMPHPEHTIEPCEGILGTQYGVCDLGIYLEELRVAAGQTGASATMRREVKAV